MMSWLPEGVSTFAPQIDRLFYGIYYLTAAVFLAVQLTLLVFVVRYRYRPDRRAEYTHGNTPLEIVWTVGPAIILVCWRSSAAQPGRTSRSASRRATSRWASPRSSSTGRPTTRARTARSAPTTTS